MVKVGFGPTDFLVAGLALVSKRAFVRIIFQMAGHATCRQLLRVQWRAVTGLAFRGQVFAK